MLNILRQLAGIILALIVIPLLIISSIDRAAEQTLFEADTYKSALENRQIYDDIIPFVLSLFITNDDFEEGGSFFPLDRDELAEILTEADRRRIAELFIPPDLIQQNVENSIDVLEQIIEGDFSGLDTEIELQPIQAALQGEAARQAADIILNASPDCTREQIQELRSVAANRSDQIPLCQPTALLRRTSEDVITEWFAALSSVIDTENPTFSELTRINPTSAEIIHQAANVNNQMVWFLLVCPLSLIGLIIALSVRSLKAFGVWCGVISLIAGIFLIVTIFIMQGIIVESYSALFEAETAVERFQAQIGSGLTRSIISGMSNWMIVESGIYIAVAFVLLAVAVFAPSLAEQSLALGSNATANQTASQSNAKPTSTTNKRRGSGN